MTGLMLAGTVLHAPDHAPGGAQPWPPGEHLTDREVVEYAREHKPKLHLCTECLPMRCYCVNATARDVGYNPWEARWGGE